MRYVIYTRVSTVAQSETHLGLDSQLRRCREYVKRNGGEIRTVLEEVASGSFQSPRPVVHRAIMECKQSGSILLVSELDRLGRSLAFLTTVRQQGIAVESVQHGAMSTMVFGIYATMAERERELISYRTKKGLAEAAERGVQLGSRSGFHGAHVVSNQRRHEEAMKYHKNVLKVIEQSQKDGETYEQISRRVHNYGFVTPRGKPYTAARLRRLMSTSSSSNLKAEQQPLLTTLC